MSDRLSYKIVLVGDSAVGKSSIMTRYVDNYFRQENWSTVALDFTNKTLEVENKTVKLQIWDTAGQQRFRTLSSAYYKKANAIMIVFDLMNKKSFQNIQSYWLEEVKKHCVGEPEIIILGNKQDSQAVKVNKQQLAKLEQKYGIPCLQVSAKTGDGVTQAFDQLVSKCVQKSKARLTSKKDVNAAVAKKPSGFGGKINKNKKKKQRCY